MNLKLMVERYVVCYCYSFIYLNLQSFKCTDCLVQAIDPLVVELIKDDMILMWGKIT